jgi:hypothetical protein
VGFDCRALRAWCDLLGWSHPGNLVVRIGKDMSLS